MRSWSTKFVKKSEIQNSLELSPNVHSLDIAIKTLAENFYLKKLVLFSALPLEVWTLCLDLTFLHLISHFSTCLHVLISSSSLLIDFFSRCLLFVSSSRCSVTSRFCFKRVSILSSYNLSCVLRMCDTLSSNLLCSASC